MKVIDPQEFEKLFQETTLESPSSAEFFTEQKGPLLSYPSYSTDKKERREFINSLDWGRGAASAYRNMMNQSIGQAKVTK